MHIKNIFVFLLMGIFIISMASAFEFDNVKSYDPITREVTITNAFGLGAVIGKARLNTPLNVKVGAGYQQVAEFDIWAYKDYNNAIKQFTFTDMKKKEKINRDFDLKYKTVKIMEVEDRKDFLIGQTDIGNNIYESRIIGSHFEEVIVWKKITPANLKKNKVLTIGVFTNVEIGDYIDWIPTIYGVKIKEWATWEESLNTNLLSYYKMDEVSGTVIGELGNYDATNNGATPNVAGKINTAYSFSGSSQKIDMNVGKFTDAFWDSDWSISMWINADIIPTTSNVYFFHLGDSDVSFHMNSGQSTLKLYADAVADAIVSSAISQDTWYHFVITRNTNGTIEMYLNGVSQGTYFDNNFNEIGEVPQIGARNAVGWDGEIDEFIIWERVLTGDEIINYYNGGDPPELNETGDLNPIIVLNSPSSANYTSIQNIIINFTASDDLELTDVKLYVNDILNQTNASGLNNTIYLFDLNLNDGDYTIYGKATDNESQSTNSLEIRIVIDTTPFIEFGAGTLANATNQTNDYIFVDVDLTETYFDNVTFSLFNSVGAEVNVSYTDATRSYNFTGLTDDQYFLNATVWTTTGQTNTTETRSYIIDGNPPTISNAYNLTNLLTLTLPINSTWHYNASDEHLDSCYYNSTANATQTIITCNSTINTIWTTGGNKTITFCANDTFGLESCNTEYAYIYYIQETQADNPDPITETFDATFNFTVDLINIPTTTATLVLNNTIYSPTTTTAGTNGYYFEVTVTIPNGWGNTTGIVQDWFWNYTINGVATDELTDTENITVYKLAIDDCSSYGEMIFNFSVLDEETLVKANESLSINVETDLTLTSKSNETQYITYSNEWNEDNNPQICIPNGVINNSQYWIDLTVGFSSTDHVWEFYYIDSGTLNSAKLYENFNGQTNQDIDLMDLLSADSTSFLFNYFDVDGLAVDGAIVHVMRKYIGSGLFREVERAKQDQNGDTIVHLVEEDVIYYFMITLEGVLLHTSSEYTALCQTTPCTIQIEASVGSATFPTDWDLMDGGAYTITSSASTRKIILNYTNNVSTSMNFTAYRYESDGSYTIIETGSDTGTSGSITLTIPQVAGNVSFFATVTQDNSFLNSKWINFESDARDRFGTTLAVFLGALIILTLGLFAVTEGVGTIVYVILGVVISGALGLIITDLGTGVNIVIYLVLAGGILLWKLTGSRK